MLACKSFGCRGLCFGTRLLLPVVLRSIPKTVDHGSFFMSSLNSSALLFRRYISTEPRPLKELLHKLYMKVHPDLFLQFPKEREINERSFKELRRYLEQAQNLQESHNPVDETRLDFFIKYSSNGDENGEAKLKRTTVHLSRLSERNRTAALKQTLSDLFRRVNITEEFSLEGFFSNASEPEAQSRDVEHSTNEESASSFYSRHQGGGLSADLRMFLRQVQEEARARMLEKNHVDREIGILKHFLLQHHRGLRLAFERPASSSAGSDGTIDNEIEEARWQLGLMKRLTPIMERLSGRFEGTSICFSPREAQIDSFGRIFLDPDSTAEEWEALLKNINMDHVRVLQQRRKTISLQENAVAGLLGIKLVTAEFETQHSEAYTEFLDRMESAGRAGVFANHNVLAKRKALRAYAQLSLIVKYNRQTRDFSVDSRNNMLVVPTDVTPLELADFITNEGDAIMRGSKGKSAREAYFATQQDELIMTVKRTLRLSGLRKAPDVTDEEMFACCTSLRQYAEQFGPYCIGLHFVVSKQQVPTLRSTGVVEIPWDFGAG